MAITNLTNTTWKFNDTITTTFTGASITFTTLDGQTFTGGLKADTSAGTTRLLYYTYNLHQASITAYWATSGGWNNEAYRTITITGGAEVENPVLIAWLETNAVYQEPLQFAENSTTLKVYENLTLETYARAPKDEHAFYIVKDKGVYKGTNLIAYAQHRPLYRHFWPLYNSTGAPALIIYSFDSEPIYNNVNRGLGLAISILYYSSYGGNDMPGGTQCNYVWDSVNKQWYLYKGSGEKIESQFGITTSGTTSSLYTITEVES